ncbi:M56 family metallopeptidase [Hymenobacter sp. ASUV-10]|uniref:M56 family metallopeptidase n=1 Tax=Hymenobacter aranciens TaxID=3063996 RepID=A0ABT9B8Z0_9BACT|nr:M56 family metallopeptidase [Hymenobacter sp. ASUV-10]MDO7873492.1 M56 family metallopeptidase [Hymenobacter sp. ASUV-10]
MSALLLYLLKVNAGLLLLAAVYYGLLRRLTFFGLNRAYLLLALGFAALGPVLPVPAWWTDATPLPAAVVAWVPVDAAAGPPVAAGAAPAAAIDWPALGLALYGLGGAVLLTRLLAQLLAVARLRRQSRPAVAEGVAFRRLEGEAGPFSFGADIYVNPARHPAGELAAVLRHEQVHVRQWHTLDVLAVELVRALAWCNPAAWLLRRAVLDNLEYLADHHALQTGLDRRAYQYSLLRLSSGAANPTLVSPFTLLTLKNRIAMMNTPSSPTAHSVRYLLAVPLVAAMALGFGAVQAQKPAPIVTATGRPPLYYIDGKLSGADWSDKIKPEEIESMNVLKGEAAQKLFGAAAADGVVIVTTKNNKNAPDVLAFNAKIEKVVPTVPGTESPAEISALVPKALATITKKFPNSRIIGVTKLSYPSTGKTVYKVQLAEGRRPSYIYFDEQGTEVKPLKGWSSTQPTTAPMYNEFGQSMRTFLYQVDWVAGATQAKEGC